MRTLPALAFTPPPRLTPKPVPERSTIFVSGHISLRPEVRIYAGDPGGVIEPPFGIFRVSMAVGYHW